MKCKCNLLFFLIASLIIANRYVQSSPLSNFKNGHVLQDDNVFTYVECSPKDFAFGNSCTLSCSVVPSGLVQYYQADFYYTNRNNRYYEEILFTNQSDITITKNSSIFSIDLKLDDYRAASYVCNVILRNVTSGILISYDHIFETDPGRAGIPLESPCKAHQECLALNSQCYHGTCQCVSFHYVMSTNDISSSACLTMSRVNTLCQSWTQCRAYYDNYDPDQGYADCMNGLCRYH